MTTAQSTSFALWIAGPPRGKDRPRFVKATGRTFTTKATENAEANIVAVWREMGSPRVPDGPVALEVQIVVERPASHYRSNGIDLNAEGTRRGLPDNKKPDVDNCLKLVMDAMNGRAYRDDVQIVQASVGRVWGDRAGLRVVARSLCAEAAA